MPTRKPMIVAAMMPVDGDHQRVQNADDQRAAKGRVGRIVDQPVGDVEARAAAQKSQSRSRCSTARRFSIVLSTIHQTPSDQQQDQHHLEDEATDLRIIEERSLGRRAAWMNVLCRHRVPLPMTRPRPAIVLADPKTGRPEGYPSPARWVGQRIGMPYCRPPLVHSALTPRAILSGLPAPTLRSKISP